MDNNYNIKLYAHGVPDGQSTWGVESSDNNYIETLYNGRKFPVQMCVEVRQQPGGQSYCYYTYMRTENISDCKGRTGSYFALTLRINYYYADIQNIYNILDAAYNKFIVGTIVDVRGETTKYKIANLAQADNTLSSLGKELENYLMQFSCDSDFSQLQGFRTTNQNVVKCNLHECVANTIRDYVRNGSSISVSPLHPSTEEQKRIQEMNAKINDINNQAQRRISETQQDAQHKIDAAMRQAQQQVNEAKREKETEIQKIRNQYKNADNTIQTQKKNLEDEKKENERLRNDVARLNDELNAAKAKLKENETAKIKINKYNNAFNQIINILSTLKAQQEHYTPVSPKTEGRNNNKGGNSPEQKEKRHMPSAKIIRTAYSVIKFLIELFLAVFIIISLCKRESPKVQYTRHSENNVQLKPNVSSKVAISITAAEKTVSNKNLLS